MMLQNATETQAGCTIQILYSGLEQALYWPIRGVARKFVYMGHGITNLATYIHRITFCYILRYAIDNRARVDSDDAFSVHSTRTRPRLAIIDRSIASRVAIYYTILCYTII